MADSPPLEEDTLAHLAAERDQLRQVLDRLEQGIVTVDKNMLVQVANEAAARLLGGPLPRDSVLKEPWPEALSLHELVRDVVAAGANVEREVMPSPDRVYSVVVVPSGPARSGAVLVVTDLSERERAERVEREFVANASHELRTPLATIAGAVEILQAGAKEIPEARDRFLRHIEREVTRLSRLVGGLLSIARAQARHELPHLAAVRVRPVLEDAAERLEPSDDLEVVVVCPPQLAVVAEPDLLFEIVSNLVANAAKYTSRGRIELAASASGGTVAIEVRDTGEGVPDEEQALLFGRFYRGGARSADGFGLGLAIVREGVNALGGGVELESQPGIGTTVRVTLPDAATT